MYDAYNGKFLRIDLTARQVEEEELPIPVIEKFLGGMGFGTYYLTREVDPGIDALSPENKIIFATGPLTGTGAPLFAQTCLVTKSPLTGGIINCYCGGDLSVHLKRSGYDFIIFEGKSDELLYVTITPEGVKFKECPELVGATVNETEDYIKEREGNGVQTAIIGTAGENMVRFASVISATRAFGRGGAGAVMGSKGLKGFAVGGFGGVRVHDPEEFQKHVDTCFDIFKKATDNEWSLLGMFSRYGTGSGMDLINQNYALATRNHKYAHFEDSNKIDGMYYYNNTKSRRVACFGCPVHCGQIHSFEEGKAKGLVTRGPEYETMYALGSDCLNNDPEVLARAHQLCEEYGMDTLSAGCTIAFAMECYEKGLLSTDEDRVKLEFGNGEAILKTLEMIAHRKGYGDILADGTKRASAVIGADSKDFAMNVKGLEFAAWMPQRMTGIALTFATSNRGACHKRAPIGAELMGELPMESIENKAAIVKEIQDRVNAVFTLVSCRFAEFELGLDTYAGLVNAATGMNKTPAEMMEIGERIWNLERLFNLGSGLSGADDILPQRCFEPIDVKGEKKGLKREDFEQMLKEYYQIRGWDAKGVPTAEKLQFLGIEAEPWK